MGPPPRRPRPRLPATVAAPVLSATSYPHLPRRSVIQEGSATGRHIFPFIPMGESSERVFIYDSGSTFKNEINSNSCCEGCQCSTNRSPDCLCSEQCDLRVNNDQFSLNEDMFKQLRLFTSDFYSIREKEKNLTEWSTFSNISESYLGRSANKTGSQCRKYRKFAGGIIEQDNFVVPTVGEMKSQSVFIDLESDIYNEVSNAWTDILNDPKVYSNLVIACHFTIDVSPKTVLSDNFFVNVTYFIKLQQEYRRPKSESLRAITCLKSAYTSRQLVPKRVSFKSKLLSNINGLLMVPSHPPSQRKQHCKNINIADNVDIQYRHDITFVPDDKCEVTTHHVSNESYINNNLNLSSDKFTTGLTEQQETLYPSELPGKYMRKISPITSKQSRFSDIKKVKPKAPSSWMYFAFWMMALASLSVKPFAPASAVAVVPAVILSNVNETLSGASRSPVDVVTLQPSPPSPPPSVSPGPASAPPGPDVSAPPPPPSPRPDNESSATAIAPAASALDSAAPANLTLATTASSHYVEVSPSGAWSVAPPPPPQASTPAAPAPRPPPPQPPPPPMLPPALPSRKPFRPPPAPHLHQNSRHGPYFEDGEGPANVTARVGSTVRLDCRVGLLHDKTVTWVHRKPDSIHLLTVGKVEYSSDQRIHLAFRYPSNWRLEILYVTRRDEGLYECQVATHPPRVRQTFLKVTAPEVSVVDESGRGVSERYYKAGSAVELTCVASQLEEAGEPLVWRHGDAVLDRGVSVNASVVGGAVVSTLTVERATRGHSGNYTCAVGSLASVTVAVHVLNGELPAAVQHGSGAGGAGGGRPPEALYLLVSTMALYLVATTGTGMGMAASAPLRVAPRMSLTRWWQLR